MWDVAKQKLDSDADASAAIVYHEEYSDWMNKGWRVLAGALEVSRAAVKAAGVDPASEECRRIRREAQDSYEKEHLQPPPAQV